MLLSGVDRSRKSRNLLRAYFLLFILSRLTEVCCTIHRKLWTQNLRRQLILSYDFIFVVLSPRPDPTNATSKQPDRVNSRSACVMSCHVNGQPRQEEEQTIQSIHTDRQAGTATVVSLPDVSTQRPTLACHEQKKKHLSPCHSADSIDRL